MGFFTKKEKKQSYLLLPDPKKENHSIGMEYAKTLYHALQKKELITKNASLPKWKQEFDLLLKKHTKEEVDQILNWFVSTLGKKGNPKGIYSAKSFCERFGYVKEYYQGSEADLAERTKVTQADLPGFFQEIYQMVLEAHQWPKDCQRQLAWFIEESRRPYKEFLNNWCTMMDEFKARVNPCRTDKWFLYYNVSEALLNYYTVPPDWILQWCRLTYEEINWRTGWKGDLAPWVWDQHQIMFVRLSRTWTAEYTQTTSEVLDAICKTAREELNLPIDISGV